MKLKSYKRLEQLEQIHAKRASTRRATVTRPPPSETIRKLLLAMGFQQGPNESLIETLARALGMACQELRDRLSKGGSLRDVFQERIEWARQEGRRQAGVHEGPYSGF
jgi:hypothetical protein